MTSSRLGSDVHYPAPAPHGIMFHHFHGGDHLSSEGSISSTDLERIVDYVGPERILGPAEWLMRLRENRLRDTDLCLSFDDSLKSQLDIAIPVLENRGIQAFWFIYSGVLEGRLERLEIYRRFRNQYFDTIDAFYDVFFECVGASAYSVDENEITKIRENFPFYSENDVRYRLVRDRVLGTEAYERIVDAIIDDAGTSPEELARGLWMTTEDVSRLSAQGHEIGLHTHTHPTRLAALQPAGQEREYRRNFEFISQICGRPPKTVAHPSNSYGPETLTLLDRLGIECGFRAAMVPPGGDGRINPTPLEIAREDHSNIMRAISAVGTRR